MFYKFYFYINIENVYLGINICYFATVIDPYPSFPKSSYK